MQQTEVSHTSIQPIESISFTKPDQSLSPSSTQQIALSIVVPVMNEQQNVALLYEKLSAQLDTLGKQYEVIFVDDGSVDGTFDELAKLHAAYPDNVRVI